MPCVTKAALRALPPEKVRDGSAFISLIRGIGNVTGMTLLTAIFSTRADYHLSKLSETLEAASIGVQQAMSDLAKYLHMAGVPDGLASIKSLSMVFQVVTEQAIIDAYNDTFLFMAVLLVISILPAALLKKTR